MPMLNALRETCLAIVESTWLRDLERAYEDSKNRHIAAYKQSTSISELRQKIEHENRRLHHEVETVSHRLEQMLDASHGRSARASDKLSRVLDWILRWDSRRTTNSCFFSRSHALCGNAEELVGFWRDACAFPPYAGSKLSPADNEIEGFACTAMW